MNTFQTNLRKYITGLSINRFPRDTVVYSASNLGSVSSQGRNLRLSVFRNVSDDWITALPGEKARYFEAVVHPWECTYAMMSIALDDALSFRTRGELVCARQQVSIAADFLARLSYSLVSLCSTVSRLGRKVNKLPAVEPMNASFFRGNIAQSAASWNGILHHVLFGTRSRFFHKLRILSDTMDQIETEFRSEADDLAKGLAIQPSDCWKELDSLHYDFNTCLRETEVVLKSFLRALPNDHFQSLCAELDALAKHGTARVKPRLSRASA
jgi:hypothetical protein